MGRRKKTETKESQISTSVDGSMKSDTGSDFPFFYEGHDREKFTPLTGANLNKPLRYLLSLIEGQRSLPDGSGNLIEIKSRLAKLESQITELNTQDYGYI